MLCVHVSVNIIAGSPFYSCVVELPLPTPIPCSWVLEEKLFFYPRHPPLPPYPHPHPPMQLVKKEYLSPKAPPPHLHLPPPPPPPPFSLVRKNTFFTQVGGPTHTSMQLGKEENLFSQSPPPPPPPTPMELGKEDFFFYRSHFIPQPMHLLKENPFYPSYPPPPPPPQSQQLGKGLKKET